MPPENDAILTYEAANEYIKKRSLLPTALNSLQISEEFSEKILVNSFFSAKIADVNLLNRLRLVSDRYSAGEIDLASARLELRRFLIKDEGFSPHGSLSNIASMSRINLILEQNRKQAAAVADYALGRDPDIEDIYPCWRYVESSSITKRDDHLQYAGKVFLKKDPVWHKIFPPNGFGCNCTVENSDAKPSPPLKELSLDSSYSFDPAVAFDTLPESPTLDGKNLFKFTQEYFSTHPDADWVFTANLDRQMESAAEMFETQITSERKEHIFKPLSRAEIISEANQAVDKDTLDKSNAWFNALSDADKNIILDWTEKDKNSLNAFFRPPFIGKDIPLEHQKDIDALNSLIDDAPKFIGSVYRGAAFKTEKEAQKYLDLLFNNPIELDGFSSFSPSMETAYYYANQPKGGEFKLITIIPNSKHGVYLGSNSLQGRDKEVLLNQKTYFRGLTNKRVGNTVYVIAEEVYDENR